MALSLKSALTGIGAALAALLCVGPASAQYETEPYPPRQQYERQGYDRQGYDQGYDRRQYAPRGEYDRPRGYDDRRGYEGRRSYEDGRRDDYDGRRRDRSYADGRGDRRYDGGMPRGWDRLSIEDQKQAIKNERRAQKKAFKRAYGLD